MKKNIKKLALKSTTIRTLTIDQAKEVQGGLEGISGYTCLPNGITYSC